MVINKGLEYQGLKLARQIGISDESCAKLKAKTDEIKLVMFGSDEQIVKYYQNYGQNMNVESVEQSYNKAKEMFTEMDRVKPKKDEKKEAKAEAKKSKTQRFDNAADIMDMFGGSEHVDEYAI